MIPELLVGSVLFLTCCFVVCWLIVPFTLALATRTVFFVLRECLKEDPVNLTVELKKEKTSEHPQ